MGVHLKPKSHENDNIQTTYSKNDIFVSEIQFFQHFITKQSILVLFLYQGTDFIQAKFLLKFS